MQSFFVFFFPIFLTGSVAVSLNASPLERTGKETHLASPSVASGKWHVRTSPAALTKPQLATIGLVDPPPGEESPFLSLAFESDGRDGVWIETEPPVFLEGQPLEIRMFVFGTESRGEVIAEFLDSEGRIHRLPLLHTGHSGWKEAIVQIPGEFLLAGERPDDNHGIVFRGLYIKSYERGVFRIYLTPPRFLIRPYLFLEDP